MDRATDLELPEAAAYRFRGFALDPSRGVLLRPDGAEVGLRPKAAAVLRQLVRSPGRVVSRDDLMEAVWPGVVVTDDSITQCVAEIRRALGDEGAQLLRTFSRRGYMLVAEVAAGDAWPAAAAAPKGGAPPFRDGTAAALARGVSGLEDAPSRHRLRHRAALLAAPALLTGALASGIGWQGLSSDRVPPVASSPVATPPEPSDPGAETAPATPRPYLSMVVLPFAPLGGDAEQDQLADGITEEVTSAVALISGSFVIGRGAAFAYKGQAADARRIGRELGVRYVVQGSARRERPQVRINVRSSTPGRAPTSGPTPSTNRWSASRHSRGPSRRGSRRRCPRGCWRSRATACCRQSDRRTPTPWPSRSVGGRSSTARLSNAPWRRCG